MNSTTTTLKDATDHGSEAVAWLQSCVNYASTLTAKPSFGSTMLSGTP
jgi:hypothetical protein